MSRVDGSANPAVALMETLCFKGITGIKYSSHVYKNST